MARGWYEEYDAARSRPVSHLLGVLLIRCGSDSFHVVARPFLNVLLGTYHLR